MSTVNREDIVHRWNDTARPLPKWQGIEQLVEHIVDLYPDAKAVEHREASLSYRELNNRSNQLAQLLINTGIHTECLVGVALHKGIDSIVAILGILKAGGAYLPLDPCYPAKHLRFLAEDSGVRMILTEEAFAGSFSKLQGIQLMTMPGNPVDDTEQDVPVPDSDRTASDLAYVIYTSGTTGSPKGVMIEHGGLCNLLDTHVAKYGVGPGDRLLHFVSLSFDAGTMHLFLALCSGATSVLTDREEFLANPGDFLREKEISFAALPASVLERISPGQLPHLKTVTAGADVLSSGLAKRWGEQVCLYNAYGPTEATILSTLWKYEPGYERPPIGRPVANVQVYILDDYLNPVPELVTGELYIGGIQLARGYLNRGSLTNERFIKNPFGPGRLYRTGDLGRYLPDGCIDFIGRKDNQVKLRGYRIELEEIEIQLKKIPGICQAAVLVNDEQLVAFISAQLDGERLVSKDIQKHLEAQLPGYMVPASIHVLDEMPLNDSGKIDRSKLKGLHAGTTSLQNSEEPDNEVEEVIHSLWRTFLKQAKIGMTDEFHTIGGDSISSMKILARMRKVFDLNLPPNMIMKFPTIRLLSKELANLSNASDLKECAIFYLIKDAGIESDISELLNNAQQD